jgi:hypothetical protein
VERWIAPLLNVVWLRGQIICDIQIEHKTFLCRLRFRINNLHQPP